MSNETLQQAVPENMRPISWLNLGALVNELYSDARLKDSIKINHHILSKMFVKSPLTSFKYNHVFGTPFHAILLHKSRVNLEEHTSQRSIRTVQKMLTARFQVQVYFGIQCVMHCGIHVIKETWMQQNRWHKAWFDEWLDTWPL